MQQLIADFLFQYKYCTIPDLGTLYLKDEPASVVFGDQKITAPKPIISFAHSFTNKTSLHEYVASQKNISSNDAIQLLKDYSDEVNNLQLGKGVELKAVGRFYKNEESIIVFTALELSAIYLPNVHAQRVVHPNDAHSMLVGETETNTAAMAEYYAEEEPTMKSKWWITATIISVISIAAIVYNVVQNKRSSFFGINQKVVPTILTDSTYKILP